MSNRVSENFNEFDDQFGEQAGELVKKEASRLGFTVKAELWRGLVYQQKKVGTVIVRGLWQNQPAVLKLQAVKPVIEEAELITRFEKHNQSKRIRAPKVFYFEPWDEARGYGLMIMEAISAPTIYKKPRATARERAAFVDFYTEFRTKVVTTSWLERDEREENTERFLHEQLASWLKINASADPSRRLPETEQAALVEAYREVIARLAPHTPMVFGHGHLGPDDILVESPGHYVLLANFFWSWRPRRHDLAFNVWVALMALWKEDQPTLDHANKIVADWLAAYRDLPMTKADPHFERNFKFMLLERCIGSVLVDLVVAEREPLVESKREIQLNVMRRLVQQFVSRQ